MIRKYTFIYLPFLIFTYLCVWLLFSLKYDILLDNNPYHPKSNSYFMACISLTIIMTKLIFILIAYNPFIYKVENKMWFNVAVAIFFLITGLTLVMWSAFIRNDALMVSGFWTLGVMTIVLLHLIAGILIKKKLSSRI